LFFIDFLRYIPPLNLSVLFYFKHSPTCLELLQQECDFANQVETDPKLVHHSQFHDLSLQEEEDIPDQEAPVFQNDPLEPDVEQVQKDDDGTFLCPSCHYKSPKKSNVKQHMLYKHTTLSQRNWICTRCDSQFVEQKGLTRHDNVCRGRGAKMLGRPVGSSKRKVDVVSPDTKASKSQRLKSPVVCRPCYVKLEKPSDMIQESGVHNQEKTMQREVKEIKKFSFTHNLAAMAIVETSVGPIGKCSSVLHTFRYMAVIEGEMNRRSRCYRFRETGATSFEACSAVFEKPVAPFC